MVRVICVSIGKAGILGKFVVCKPTAAEQLNDWLGRGGADPQAHQCLLLEPLLEASSQDLDSWCLARLNSSPVIASLTATSAA